MPHPRDERIPEYNAGIDHAWLDGDFEDDGAEVSGAAPTY